MVKVRPITSRFKQIVFTHSIASSRDYVRITGQVKGDGDPSCFSNVEDTGIPSLKTLANSVQVYVNGINGDVTVADRESLHKKWESTPQGGEGMYGMIVIVTMKACIASSWSTLFESDLFASLSDSITTCISKLITDGRPAQRQD